MKRFQKIDGFSWSDVMNCRNEIFGISILWIMFFHIFCQTGVVGIGGRLAVYLSKILYRGNIGVDIFLFLSAIGLCKSMQSNTTQQFYKHRFNRVVLPYLFLAIPFFIWMDLFILKDGFLQLLLNVTTINYWLTGKHPTWYIAFIVIMYLSFPLFYRWDEKSKHVSTIIIIIISVISEYLMFRTNFFLYNTSERALSRVPVFMGGLLFGSYILSGKAISFWQVLLLSFVGLWFFAVISKMPPDNIILLRYTFIPIAVSIIVSYAYIRKMFVCKWLWKVFAWIGTISLELYVSHVLLLRIPFALNIWSSIQPALWWIIIPLVSLILALLLQYITKQFIKIEK